MASIVRYKRVGTPEWVDKQHKTMIRWINSKLDTNLTDLSKDLSDGLVLILLINKIITEMDLERTDLKLYLLKPLYTKPKLPIQKLENLNDFLEFIRIVLKVNITSISGDNIMEGNLKLILGLTWSLFIFSSTTSIGIMNDGNSVIQIKSIILGWVNSKFKLHQIANFDRDWSLEVTTPDQIFHAILKHYLPGSKVLKLTESKLQNMQNILNFAEELGITKLADIDDFKSLVPDEKCILFYTLEWYKFFELGNFQMQETQPEEEEETVKESFDEVLIRMSGVIKCKFEYETVALRFSNKVTSINKRCEKILQLFTEEVFEVLQRWDKRVCAIEESDDPLVLICSEDFRTLTALHGRYLDVITKAVLEYDEMTNIINNSLFKDLQSLVSLSRDIKKTLALLAPDFKFETLKGLDIDTLQEKHDKFLGKQAEYASKFESHVTKLLHHNAVSRLEKHSLFLEAHISNKEEASIDMGRLSEFTDKLRAFKCFVPAINVSDTHESTGDKNFETKYSGFKDQLMKFDSKLITNEMEFTIILEELTSSGFDRAYIKHFIKYVPLKLVNLSFNDSDFSLNLESDDDDSEIDNSKLIFETQRRKVGSQLGNDRIYDLEDFFHKFENGLKLT